MSGYDEAVAWFRADPLRVRDLDDVDNRSAVIAIVNAVLAGAVPAGRDLTAQDVDDALHIDCPTNEQIAERLNRIARPSGGVGQPDTVTASAGFTLDSQGRRVEDGWDHDGDLIASLQVDMHRLAGERDALVTAARGLLDALDGLIAADYDPDRAARSMESAIPPLRALVFDEESPRSWSLPAPPPDDVTVVHVVDGDRYERMTSTLWALDGDVVNSIPWKKLIGYGTVVEGEPPAPEPQAAERGRDLTYRDLEDAWVNVPGVTTAERRDRAVDHLNRIARPAAEPPRFERGFYRLARDLDTEHGVIRERLVFAAHLDTVDEVWRVFCESGDAWVSAAALAAAGAERINEEDR